MKKRPTVNRKGQRQGHSGKRHVMKIHVPEWLNLKPFKTGIYKIKLTVTETKTTLHKLIEVRNLENYC